MRCAPVRMLSRGFWRVSAAIADPVRRAALLRREGAEILVFCGLAYAIAWACWLPLWQAGVVVRAGSLPTHFPGLLAPLLAAVLTTWLLPGRSGARRDLGARLRRWRLGARGWALALVPGALLLLVLGLGAVAGAPGSPAGLGRFSGLPAMPGWLLFATVLLVNGYGEEGGWRGFLLPRLQRRFGAVGGVLVQGAIWAGWHAPLFAIVETYRGMGAAGLVFGFGLGLMCGAFVLARVAAGAHGAVLAVALWHTLYNFATASAVGGWAQAGVSAAVMAWGMLLFARALASGAGRRAIRVPPPRVRVLAPAASTKREAGPR